MCLTGGHLSKIKWCQLSDTSFYNVFILVLLDILSFYFNPISLIFFHVSPNPLPLPCCNCRHKRAIAATLMSWSSSLFSSPSPIKTSQLTNPSICTHTQKKSEPITHLSPLPPAPVIFRIHPNNFKISISHSTYYIKEIWHDNLYRKIVHFHLKWENFIYDTMNWLILIEETSGDQKRQIYGWI